MDDLDQTLGPNQVILGSSAHVFLGKDESKVGDKEIFYGTEFEVVGVLEPTGLGIDDSGYMTLDTVYALAQKNIDDPLTTRKLDIAPGEISALMVKVDPEYDRSDVAQRIQREVPDVGVVTSTEVVSTSIASQLENLTPIFLLIGAGFWLIAVLMIGAIFSMSVNERRREIGLIQAIGATRGYIFKQVILEAVELTAVGGAAGIAIGAVIVLALKDAISSSLTVGYLWPSAVFVVTFVLGYIALAIITGIIAALYPAYTASRLEPYQAIRSGE